MTRTGTASITIFGSLKVIVRVMRHDGEKPSWSFTFEDEEIPQNVKGRRSIVIKNEWIGESSLIQRGKVSKWMSDSYEFILRENINSVLGEVARLNQQLEIPEV